jgi:hypothetical protein
VTREFTFSGPEKDAFFVILGDFFAKNGKLLPTLVKSVPSIPGTLHECGKTQPQGFKPVRGHNLRRRSRSLR